MFVYASAIAAVAGVLMGLVPALRASRAQVTALLHDGGARRSAGAGRQRLRSAMVVAQVAGSLVLLIVAGLCVRSSQRAQFDGPRLRSRERADRCGVDPHQVGYDGPRTAAFYEELERRLRALPGVESVGMSFSVPMGYIFDGCVAAPRRGRRGHRRAASSNVGCNTGHRRVLRR